MKIIDSRNPSKQCYLDHLSIGDTFLLGEDLYYIYDKNTNIKAINLSFDTIHIFNRYGTNPIQVIPVECSICILKEREV